MSTFTKIQQKVSDSYIQGNNFCITGPRDDPNQEESGMEECLDTIEKKNSLRSKAEALRSKAEAEGWYLGPLTPMEEALQEEGQASLKKQLEELKKQLDEL